MPFPPGTREKVREKFDAGLLPRRISAQMTAGHGHGHPCDACDVPIGVERVEYEVDGEGMTARFHLGCAGLWEEERRKRGFLSPLA